MISLLRFLRLLPLVLSMILMMVLGIHGVMKETYVPNEYEEMDYRSDAGINGALYPGWLGKDLPELLGPLQTLSGKHAPVSDRALTLWVVVGDRECTVCLYELPLIASFVDSLNCSFLSVRAVALGDRHEARRTLWGIETDMPVFVSSGSNTMEDLGVDMTPVRILTWYGRVVGICEKPVNTVIGRNALLHMTGQWISQSPQ